ncbi:Zinc finger protein 888-like 1 [Homarus americanus]|uniref:Zinc finger protein 888-like 1 n=1 Tax=Homarus americanus TaxID=6706 RepID=A0A8J5K506_HOMAM|nr:Zinc finger protein 888-like 1 [Homarus americanus]
MLHTGLVLMRAVWSFQAEAVSLRRGGGADNGDDASGRPTCPVCSTTFSFHSQLRRHVRHEHPDFDTSELESSTSSFSQNRRMEEVHMELEEEGTADDMPVILNLSCSWCDLEFDEKEAYDQHLDGHNTEAYQQYLTTLDGSEIDVGNFVSSVTVHKETNVNNGKSVGLNDVKSEVPDSTNAINYKTGKTKDKEITLDSDEKRDVKEENPSYMCNVCGMVNSSKVNMECHLDKCHEGVARHCGLCHELCLDAASLRSHLVHHYNGVLVCPVCPIRFSIRCNLIAHLEYCHYNGYAIPCDDCDAEFTNYDVFEAHRAHEHGRGALRTCEVCDKEILAIDIDKHMAKHEDSKMREGEMRPHACNLCHASFFFATQLHLHKYREHPDALTFKCDECERRFRTVRMLTSHKWGHRYGTHQCPACRLKYRQVDQLKRHLLSVHPELEGYNCKFCPTTLKNYSTYVSHLKFKHPREAGYDKKPVRCKLCGESFAHKVQWKYHMRNHSRSLQTCEICGITIKNLEIHMNLHTKEKKYECSDCGAVYHNKASFHFHVKRVHMGVEVRKHMCAICVKGFLTPADLRIHMSRVHRGERNYWCTTCNKGYKSRVSLTYHQRLHTGERPHHCTLCGRSFRVPSYLKRHMEHDHRAQYPGVYYKQGRPKSQEDRSQAQRHYPHQSLPEPTISALEETATQIPEIVQITVPMEMGGEVISAVGSAQDLGRDQHLDLEQGGVVYVVYEN